MDDNSTPKNVLSQIKKDFYGMIESRKSWWTRVCWCVYSIVFDATRVAVLLFAAIGYAIRDAARAAREEFGDE